jgi:hypothetical protein
MCPILNVRATINVRILLSLLWEGREELLSEWLAIRKPTQSSWVDLRETAMMGVPSNVKDDQTR